MMNSLYLFYNASIQGTMTMMGALRHRKVRHIAMGIVTSAILLDTLNRLVAGDDDDDENHYDKIPEWQRERNIILMVPGGENGERIMFPAPWGYNVFHTMGQQISSVLWGKKDPLKAAVTIATTALNAFNPIGGPSTIASLITPTIADPIIDIYTNKDHFGRKIMPDNTWQERAPDSTKYWSTVNPAAKWLAENLNKWTGGSEVRPGYVDISPETFEHWGNFVAGGAGAFAQRTQSAFMKLIRGEDIETHETPFLRRVYGTTSPSADRQRYFEIRDAVELTKQELKMLTESGRRKEAAEIRKERVLEVRMQKIVAEAEKQRTKIRKEIRKIEANRNLSTETKQRSVQKLREATDRLMLSVRKRFNRNYALDKGRLKP